ncbi:hypothetical protein IJJ39_02065 [Candidatus Saccharibacteria bacterium]|nr:hypothetical protein [Candidatus Saccharibacteria bacterium]MBR0488438.1 hypothetical protein [Candidatus Saccharibacteria bacterium]
MNGLKYWDPEESMKSVAQTEYAAHPELYSDYVDPSTGITDDNYFYVASLYRLGTAQAAQFQSGNQTGAAWHWASRLNEAGDILRSEDGNQTVANADSGYNTWHQDGGVWLENNSRSDMPRSYHDGNNAYGDYYNWYAATAESGHFSTTGTVHDSLCPKGWQLPNGGGTTTTKSWQGLLFGSYGLDSSAASSKAMRENPLSFAFTGLYDLANGSLSNRGSYGYWRSATAASASNVRNLALNSSIVNPQYSYSKPHGFTVRCLLAQ